MINEIQLEHADLNTYKVLLDVLRAKICCVLYIYSIKNIEGTVNANAFGRDMSYIQFEIFIYSKRLNKHK